VNAFLDDFPSVTKEQAIALPDMTNKILTSENAEQPYAADVRYWS